MQPSRSASFLPGCQLARNKEEEGHMKQIDDKDNRFRPGFADREETGWNKSSEAMTEDDKENPNALGDVE